MSAKKAPSKRHASPVKAAGSSGVQSAAERKAAEVEVRRLIDTFSPEDRRPVGAMRRLLKNYLPTAHEVVYEYRDCFVISYSPSVHGYEGVIALRGSAEGVRLYFNRGKELADPEKLLQGTGGQTRFVVVESVPALSRPPVANFIEGAIAGNRVPFASEGQGSIIIRSASAKKGRQRRSA